MAFESTASAIRARQQTVTRRFKHEFGYLKAGDTIEAVAAGWMVSYVGKVPILATLKVVSVTFEPVRRMTDDPIYGKREHLLEGHPASLPVRARIAALISRHRDLTLDTVVARIEFSYG